MNLTGVFSKCFNDMTNYILFGESDFPIFDGKILSEIIKKVTVIALDLISDPVNLITLHVLPKLGLDKRKNRMVNLCEIIRYEIKQIIERRQHNYQKENLGSDVINLMLNYNLSNPGNELRMEEMIGNVSGLLNTGNDSSKNTTETFLKFISQKPEIITQITKEELPKIFKVDEDWEEYDNFHKSEFLIQTIDETMRLVPPAAISFSRKITIDIWLGEFKLKRGSEIIISTVAMHNNEKYFKNPEQFIPERFSKENKKSIDKNSYMPFLNGRRKCIGKNLAELMMRMLICNLMHRFEIKGTDRGVIIWNSVMELINVMFWLWEFK